MLCFIVKITPKAEYFSILKSKLEEARGYTIKEKGCHLYLLHESVEGLHKSIYIYESFYSQADFDFHIQQEYIKEILSIFETTLDCPVEIIHLNAI